MIRSKIRGSRKPRVVLAGCIAAVAVMGLAGTAPATTAPQAFPFDFGKLKLGRSGDPIVIVDPSPPAHFPVLTADVCTDATGGCAAGNDFTVTPPNFDFTPFPSNVSGVPG